MRSESDYYGLKMISKLSGILSLFIIVKGNVDLINLSNISDEKFEAIRNIWRNNYSKSRISQNIFDEDLKDYISDYRQNPGIKIGYNDLVMVLDKNWRLESDYQTRNLDLEEIFVCDGEPCKWKPK